MLVAENGALLVVDRELSLQAAYFLAEHLVLVCPADQILHHMHEAYHRMGVAEQPVSGPSKTADVEQSLVTSAKGPRALTVLVIG